MTNYDWDVLELAAGISDIAPGKDPPVYRPDGMHGWIFNATLNGAGRINRDADPFHVGPGKLLLFPPGVIHDYDESPEAGRWEHAWVYFFASDAWADVLDWPESHGGVRVLPFGLGAEWISLVARFQELIALARHDHPTRKRRVHNAIEDLLLRAHHRLGSDPDTGVAAMDLRMHRVMEHLERHLAEDLNVAALAEVARLSTSRFAHTFKKSTGTSPRAYLEHRRIDLGRELLLMTAKPVGVIAAQVGYPNAFYFSRVFRKLTGMSPRQFRQTVQV